MDSGRRVVFETERLVIRRAISQDVDLIHALWTNPQVMRHVGFPEGLRVTRSEVSDRLAGQSECVLEQLLVVELKATGQGIGECKLAAPDEAGIAEPDTKLLPQFWGHHYGAEVWRALVAYQFMHTDCEAVQGTPNVENTASIKMQEGAGMACIGQGIYHFPESMQDYTVPVPHYTYRVSRAEWEARQKP